MRRTRLARYKEKSAFIVTAIESIPDTLESDIERNAAYCKLHTSIEAAMDIIAMLLKDLGKDVGDDYANIQSLEKTRRSHPSSRRDSEDAMALGTISCTATTDWMKRSCWTRSRK